MKWADDDNNGGFRSIFRAPRKVVEVPRAVLAGGDPLGDGDPADNGATGYEAFSTFTLEATLTSLRASMIVHGPTPNLRGIQRRIETELAKRKDRHDD
jgi:hypothetical protein